jgi:hypothetical protein
MVRSTAATAVSGQAIEDPTHPVRQFLLDSLET